MDISYGWLSRYVDHDLNPDTLADRLTMAGLEVEGLTSIGQSLDGVVVGEVLDVRPHPNADRLVLCDVDLGKPEPVQIVCGAPNVAKGQKAPVATVGTTLMLPSRDNPDVREPLTIEARPLRGEDSHGMICAEDELGLSDDHAGIMVLDEDATVGQPFTEYLKKRGVEPSDTIIDIGLTPNRPDAASHLGVARDVAALVEKPLQRPDVERPEDGGEAAEHVTIEIEDVAGCPRYVGLLVRNVTVQESPLWLKRRLMAIGLRPRNNIVDITNFVMHECGQPLHAFDFDLLSEGTIIVRSTTGEETFTTLDDKERTLPEGTLLICDAEQSVAIAGVMGGANSEVSDATTNVLIESAYFDPSTIRRTAKALKMKTDASYRFERGVDRDGQVWAAARAARLMVELGGGTLIPGMVDAQPEPPTARTVALRPHRMNQVLGTAIPTEQAVTYLEALGFEVKEGDDALHCTVPTFRPDVSIEEDLIEEVARLYGYDRIPEPVHVQVPNHTPERTATDALRSETRRLLKGLGFREIYTNSMLPRERAQRFNEALPGEDAAPIVETLNALSDEMAVLRPRLLPGALEAMQFNRNRKQNALRFFEFGHVFHRADASDDTMVPGYAEYEALLIALSGPRQPMHWDAGEADADFFDLKGVAETVLDDLRLPDVDALPRRTAGRTNGQAGVTVQHLDFMVSGEPVGALARVHPDVAADFDLDRAVYIAEFNWDALTGAATAHMRRAYEPVSRFPAAERDLAIIVSQGQAVGPLLDTIREAGGSILQDTTVFDLYEGEGIEAGKKSVAFALRFESRTETLTDEAVDARMDAILDALEQQHNATLRQ